MIEGSLNRQLEAGVTLTVGAMFGFLVALNGQAQIGWQTNC